MQLAVVPKKGINDYCKVYTMGTRLTLGIIPPMEKCCVLFFCYPKNQLNCWLLESTMSLKISHMWFAMSCYPSEGITRCHICVSFHVVPGLYLGRLVPVLNME